MTLDDIIEQACKNLSARQGYAQDVIRGRQRWSGGDLRGKAKRFGVTYARQRSKAAHALHQAGGEIVPVNNGRLVTAVYVGMDDFGAAVYQTVRGAAVVAGKWAVTK